MDDYYDLSMVLFNTASLTILSNTYIIGNPNGTVFDFQYDKHGSAKFNFSKTKGQKLKIENIIFTNFYEPIVAESYMLSISSQFDNFYMEFNNCTFKNIYQNILKIVINSNKPTQEEPSIIIMNTKF